MIRILGSIHVINCHLPGTLRHSIFFDTWNWRIGQSGHYRLSKSWLCIEPNPQWSPRLHGTKQARIRLALSNFVTPMITVYLGYLKLQWTLKTGLPEKLVVVGRVAHGSSSITFHLKFNVKQVETGQPGRSTLIVLGSSLAAPQHLRRKTRRCWSCSEPGTQRVLQVL